MKDLSMEDRKYEFAEGKGKAQEEMKKKDKPLKAYSRKNKKKTGNIQDDPDIKSIPIIEIESSSRSTRSTTRANEERAHVRIAFSSGMMTHG
ncbi:hypothetical protein L6452_41885 [Arctium lappa]|uniref:Uncharacterized protein n=1 Tax=Arctium lappa TaxID=4217 RepID=A0ACB8XHA7_ARCLA|nr:hypothetical protein L6452_41885 [Arctium lappa]